MTFLGPSRLMNFAAHRMDFSVKGASHPAV
jgi:hypothetical protein